VQLAMAQLTQVLLNHILTVLLACIIGNSASISAVCVVVLCCFVLA
jgi:hypothetical protein